MISNCLLVMVFCRGWIRNFFINRIWDWYWVDMLSKLMIEYFDLLNNGVRHVKTR